MEYKKGHRSRVFDKFKSHSNSFADYELLEMLLFFVIPYQDTKLLAKELLTSFGSLQGVLHAGDRLKKVSGVGDKTSLYFLALQQLILKIGWEETKSVYYKVQSPSTVADYLIKRIGHNQQESFGVVYLDGENKIINIEELFIGTVDRVVVHGRELVKKILEENAVSIIVYHNHPNFHEIKPSKEDLLLTEEIKNKISIIDVELLDHIILSFNGFLSLKSEGCI